MLHKQSGYIYNKRTAPGFQRMKRQGIVMPPFRIEDDVTRLLTNHYTRLLSKLATAIKSVRMMERVTTDSITTDGFYQEIMTDGFYQEITTDGFYQEIMGQMQDALLRSVTGDKEKLARRLSELLHASREHFFENFLEDADDTSRIRIQYALDKDEVFQQRINFLMNDYLGRSLERIKGEENELKNAFLRKLTDYALGNTPDLQDLHDVMTKMAETSAREARFFARDQFARLNKSLAMASFKAADVQYVQWWTVGDGRVRPTHKALNKQVFPINDVPDEIHDYNCRCALVPVWKD